MEVKCEERHQQANCCRALGETQVTVMEDTKESEYCLLEFRSGGSTGVPDREHF